MDTAMRDLERIREHDPEDGRARQYGVWALAALTTVALVVALGMMIGDGGEPEETRDPLAALEGLEAPEDVEDDAEVDREALTFPSALVTPERPEVAAAVAAAGAELDHPAGPDTADPPPRREEPSARPNVPDAVPAAAAAAPTAGVLARTVQEDPLMAEDEAEARPRRARAPAGRDGRYTLQVISYRSPDEARLFADTLRERGHEAFVVSADLPERGRHWRVRIGPFDSLPDAEAYRADFEEAEGMNTYVVKRDD
ncbi:MAG: SPOR domain-containing protein [Myxococcota bacterium]